MNECTVSDKSSNEGYPTIADYLINNKLVYPVDDHWECQHCDKTAKDQRSIVIHFCAFRSHYGDDDPHNRNYHTWTHDNPNIARRETEYFKVYPGDPALKYGCIWCGKRMPLEMTKDHFKESSPKEVRCGYIQHYYQKRERLAAETAETEAAQRCKDELEGQEEEPAPDVEPEPEYEDVFIYNIYILKNRSTGEIIERRVESDYSLFIDYERDDEWVKIGDYLADVHLVYRREHFVGFEKRKERRLVE